jgi:hypothetical protein
MARGRRGAVAAAIDERGAAAESVQSGIDELTQLATRSGPPVVPDDLGNFRPDLGEPQRPVTRRREPQRLQTTAEELEARRAQRGMAAEDAEPILESGAPDVPAVDEPGPDDADDGDDGVGDEPQAGSYDELAQRLAAFERRDLERDAQLSQVMARMAGGGAPGMAPPGATPMGMADPRIAAVAQKLRPESLVPFKIDEAAAQQMGMTPQGAQLVETMLRLTAQNIVGAIFEAYGLDQDARASQQTQQMTAQQTMQAVNQAFYAANPDLNAFGEVVDQTSQQLAAQYPQLRQQPAEWIKHTAAETRRKLQSWGVRVAGRGVAVAPAGGIGARPGSLPASVSRIRPATADFGTSGGGSGRRPITPQQKEMLDLAHWA